MNILDGPGVPGQVGLTGHPGAIGGVSRLPPPLRAVDPMVPGGNPPNQLNDLNQPSLQVWLGGACPVFARG